MTSDPPFHCPVPPPPNWGAHGHIPPLKPLTPEEHQILMDLVLLHWWGVCLWLDEHKNRKEFKLMRDTFLVLLDDRTPSKEEWEKLRNLLERTRRRYYRDNEKFSEYMHGVGCIVHLLQHNDGHPWRALESLKILEDATRKIMGTPVA